ncbi:MAG: hypothetical protein MJZ28_06950 [Paludibacteraceae bacterium]|nr:hypothetical protein [Paludibacteraceae bacterium]
MARSDMCGGVGMVDIYGGMHGGDERGHRRDAPWGIGKTHGRDTRGDVSTNS